MKRRRRAALFEDLLGRSRGVDVDHADHVVTALHRHANRLANAQFHDVAAGLKRSSCRASLVSTPSFRRMTKSRIVLLIVIRRRAGRRCGSAARGDRAAGLVRIEEHDATPVGLDPLENQLHDAVEQLVDVQRMADRQGRAVHHLEIAACAGQPGVLRQVGLGVEDPAAFFLRDGVDDPRWSSSAADGGNVDRTADTAVGLLGGPGVEHQGRPHLHLIAAGQQMLLHPFPVDEGPVGTVQVGDGVIAMGAAELGVVPRDLGIVQVDAAGLVASEPQDGLLQLVTSALVSSADHKQRRHDCGFRSAALGTCPATHAEGWRRIASAMGSRSWLTSSPSCRKGRLQSPLRPYRRIAKSNAKGSGPGFRATISDEFRPFSPKNGLDPGHCSSPVRPYCWLADRISSILRINGAKW